MSKQKIYLACPYSDVDFSVMEHREKLASEASALLLKAGFPTFSPITHGHNIPNSEEHRGVIFDMNLAVLQLCDVFVVLCISGWEESIGIKAEMVEAKKLKIPIVLVYNINVFIDWMIKGY
jgi:nucleoside 2-deoxyribosyltransferase